MVVGILEKRTTYVSTWTFEVFLNAGRCFQETRYATAMIYPHIISAFIDDNKHQIETKPASVTFNTQVKAIRNDNRIYAFINFMLD